jgi:ferredoxin
VIDFWYNGGTMWNRNASTKHKTIHTIEANCTGCKVCIKKCPRRVLDMTGDARNTRVFVRMPDKCDACGKCVAACKFNALSIVNSS